MQPVFILGIVLVFLGIILAVIEMILPGFGIAGISGGILIIVGIILTSDSWIVALRNAAAIAIGLGCVFLMFLVLLSKGKVNSPVVLSEKLGEEEGFVSSDDHSDMLGKTGIVESDLKPVGKAVFDDKTLEVISNGSFITKGKKITVVSVEHSKIIVKELV